MSETFDSIIDEFFRQLRCLNLNDSRFSNGNIEDIVSRLELAHETEMRNMGDIDKPDSVRDSGSDSDGGASDDVEEVLPITSELRKVISDYRPIESGDVFETKAMGTIGYSRVIDCCNAIDAIHENLELENRRLFAEVQALVARLESELANSMCPTDAEGKQIHVGDIMLTPTGYRCKVYGVGVNESGFPAFFVHARNGIDYTCYSAGHRYHADTTTVDDVKRVLGELCNEWMDADIGSEDEILTHYMSELLEIMSVSED